MSEVMKRNQIMKYRKGRCGKAWSPSRDHDVMSGEACVITNIRCDQWLAWRAGLIAEPDWHKKGKK